MARKKEISGLQIGTSSLILVFVVLCLTIFSLLSLVSAMNDMRLAQKSLTATAQYYEADSLAEKKLKEIDHAIKNARSLKAELGEIYDPVTGKIYYEIPINENLVLCVELQVINGAKYGEKRYNILKWQEENRGSYELDDSLPVWTGEESV